MISGRWHDLQDKAQEKQLFLSRRVVTESHEFDGGVLVDEKGIIEGVLTRDTVDVYLAAKNSNIKVKLECHLYLLIENIENILFRNGTGIILSVV